MQVRHRFATFVKTGICAGLIPMTPGFWAIAAQVGAVSQDQRMPAYEEFEVRAVFLLSMAKFTEWPSEALPEGAPLVIGVLGDSPMGPALEALAGAKAGDRRIVVRRFRGASDVQQPCHILYFSASEERQMSTLRRKLEASSVLTVGETSFFLGFGGALHLFQEEGRMRFTLNRASLDRSRLRVAAQVQRLAKQVVVQP